MGAFLSTDLLVKALSMQIMNNRSKENKPQHIRHNEESHMASANINLIEM
jgi:hypothetical protein